MSSAAKQTMSGAWTVWAIAASFYFTAVFHRMALGVVGIEAETRLSISHEQIAIFTALQLVIYLAMQIPAGMAADRIGPRKVLTTGLVLVAIGESIFAVANTLPTAMAGRAIVGTGDALIFLNVMRLCYRWFPYTYWPFLATLTGAIGASGHLLGTFPLQQSVTHFGWTPTFLAASALTLALAALALIFVSDKPPNSELETESNHEPRIEHEPVWQIIKTALKKRGVRHGIWTHMTLFGPFQVLGSLWGVPFLVDAHGFKPEVASQYLLALVLVFALFGPLMGAIAARSKKARDRILLIYGILQFSIWTVVLAWPNQNPPDWLLLVAFLVVGLAASGGMIGFAISGRHADDESAGVVSALVNFGGFGFGAILIAVTGLILGSEPPTPNHFAVALTPMLAVNLVALIAMTIARRPT